MLLRLVFVDLNLMTRVHLFVGILFSCFFVANAYPNTIELNLREFLRLRCSLDPSEEVITTWKGSAFLHLYQVQPRNLFNVIGMNIARCLVDEKNRRIILTTRETQLYVDVESGKKLIQWTNPFTGEVLPVMHVANDPVQNFISMDNYSVDAYLTSENQLTLPVDVNLFYPNPLYSNETLRQYSKERFYEAGEYFKFFTTLNQIKNESLTQINQMDLSWTRIAPILPWMNMSQAFNGSLIFSAQGSKVNCLSDIDEVLFNEIIQRIPIYQHAPECQLNTSSETSWTYFQKYFGEFLTKTQEFPIPKSQEDIPCVQDKLRF